MTPDPTQRFSVRAGAYSRSRPSYPAALLDLLERECGLSRHSIIADIGSGTGLLAALLLEYGCQVIGVEPNLEMRREGEEYLERYPRFRSVDGRAEATGLAEACADIITAGQAFHWFDAKAARREFLRILRPDGWLVLVWNERPPAAGGFQAEYAATANRHARDMNRVREENIDAVFGGRKWRRFNLANEQRLDRAGLIGRLSSTSYAPVPGTPEHDAMERDLSELFDRYQQDSSVTLLYETRVFLGKLKM